MISHVTVIVLLDIGHGERLGAKSKKKIYILLASFLFKKNVTMNALDLLPVELWLHVAECSPEASFRLACAVSYVGRYLLNEDVQTRAMTRFCNSKGFLPNGAKHGMHVEVDCEDYKSEVWYRNGVEHRDGDLPAVIHYRKDGIYSYSYKAWYRNGVKHRDGDLPAVIHHYLRGNLSFEVWYRNGVTHSLWFEAWYRNGVKHRDGKLPAMIIHCADGTTVEATN